MTALLALNGLPQPERQRVLSLFRNQNPGPERTFFVDGCEVIVAGNGDTPLSVQFEDGSFIAVAGVAIYKQRMGSGAVRMLLQDLVSNAVDETQLDGAFAAVSWDGRQARFFTDWLGNMCAYRNATGTVWSTSFLATAAGAGTHVLDQQGAWEYIFQGASFGESTALASVKRVDPEKWYDPLSGVGHARPDLLPRDRVRNVPFDELVGVATRAIENVFDVICGEFHGRIDTALSGGYDSRLILAALRARGEQPRVHVYGNEQDSDVQIAKSIAAGEGFELEHVVKGSLVGPLSADALAQAVERNFFAFDATPPDGIFETGSDLITRQGRMASGHLALNGGGGEIFRNFYYLLDRRYGVDDLMSAFYSRFDPQDCSPQFDSAAYLNALAQKVLAAVKTTEPAFDRNDIERTYPLFRCRYWMSHNTSINNIVGRAITPLVNVRAIREALSVPIRFKTHGRLEAAMIEKLDPRLARYRSNSRATLARGPTISERAIDYGTLLRPTWVRGLSYRLQRRLASDSTYSNWMQRFGSVIKGDWGHVRGLVSPENIRTPEFLSRAATLQYLCDRFAQMGAR
jgi:hypothetical protein